MSNRHLRVRFRGSISNFGAPTQCIAEQAKMHCHHQLGSKSQGCRLDRSTCNFFRPCSPGLLHIRILQSAQGAHNPNIALRTVESFNFMKEESGELFRACLKDFPCRKQCGDSAAKSFELECYVPFQCVFKQIHTNPSPQPIRIFPGEVNTAIISSPHLAYIGQLASQIPARFRPGRRAAG